MFLRLFLLEDADARYLSSGAVSRDLKLLTSPSQFDTLKTPTTSKRVGESQLSFLDGNFASFGENLDRPMSTTPTPPASASRLQKSTSTTLTLPPASRGVDVDIEIKMRDWAFAFDQALSNDLAHAAQLNSGALARLDG